jgi:hypothetical protein
VEPKAHKIATFLRIKRAQTLGLVPVWAVPSGGPDPGDPGGPTEPGEPTITLEVTSHDVLLDMYSIEITRVDVTEKTGTNYVDVLVNATDGEEPESRRWQLLDKNANVVREWQDSPLFEDVFKNQELIAEVKDDWDKYDAQEFASNPPIEVNETFTATKDEAGIDQRTGDIQTYTVPANGDYRITAYGSQGGASPQASGGRGAKMSGLFSLQKNDVLQILVGQMGGYTTGTRGGGGGGATIIVKNGEPILIAGGGGGAGNYANTAGIHANVETFGNSGARSSAGSGGVDGNPGNPSSNNYATGGSGWLANSVDVSWAGGAKSFNNGGDGGTTPRSVPDDGSHGGFGGGGSCHAGSGGGGGYSGGGGGGWNNSGDGGGGGSINVGTEQDNEAGAREGAGLCQIEAVVSSGIEENTTTITDVNVYEENEELFAGVVVDTLFPDGLEYQLEDDQGNVLVAWQASNVFGPFADAKTLVAKVRDVAGNIDSASFLSRLPITVAFTDAGLHTWDWEAAGSPNIVDVLVVAGGGAGGYREDSTGWGSQGGGGGGGILFQERYPVSGDVAVIVGAGANTGTTSSEPGPNGDNSSFGDLVAIGGGGGGSRDHPQGADGGAGGGSDGATATYPGGSGTEGQGNDGGQTGGAGQTGGNLAGGGGGGNIANTTSGFPGGDGGYYGDIFGDEYGDDGYFSGGGGGGGQGSVPPVGGAGGGGDGADNNTPAQDGMPNTGGGGGGSNGNTTTPSGRGGSGIVLIRF